MSKELKRKRRATVLDATIFALAGVAILIGLGVWQLDRKVWKENLIATLNTRLAVAPGDLPPRDSWRILKESEAEFRRVAFPAEFINGSKETLGIELINILSEQLGGSAQFLNLNGTEIRVIFNAAD